MSGFTHVPDNPYTLGGYQAQATNVPKAIERDETEMKTFYKAGGAKRSKAMPDWAMYPRPALRLILSRFTIGRKYGYCNWKKTLDVGAVDLACGGHPSAIRAHWHDGEETGESTLDFVRQFIGHGDEHLANAMALADKPVGAVSEKGDDLMANLAAYGWNVLCLIQYAIENEDMVREALSQYPVGSPKHRQDVCEVVTK